LKTIQDKFAMESEAAALNLNQSKFSSPSKSLQKSPKKKIRFEQDTVFDIQECEDNGDASLVNSPLIYLAILTEQGEQFL
jgi:hypothetical protein